MLLSSLVRLRAAGVLYAAGVAFGGVGSPVEPGRARPGPGPKRMVVLCLAQGFLAVPAVAGLSR